MSPDWRHSGACGGESLDLFYGPENEPKRTKGIRERKAKEVCALCIVRNRCLDYALGEPGQPARVTGNGIWGGLNEAERAAERRRRRPSSQGVGA